jgi:hypothetical protein
MTSQPAGPASSQINTRGDNPNDNGVQRSRAWSGFWVVFAGDLAIAGAAIFAVLKVSNSSSDTTSTVAILTSAFTAVSTMTTAYFGIKTMSNTAQSYAPVAHAAMTRNSGSGGGQPDGSAAGGPTGGGPTGGGVGGGGGGTAAAGGVGGGGGAAGGGSAGGGAAGGGVAGSAETAGGGAAGGGAPRGAQSA